MIQKKVFGLIAVLGVVLFFFFVSCGKVSQETGVDEKEARSFDLTVDLEAQTTANLQILRLQKFFVATSNYLLITQQPLTIAIAGIRLENNDIKIQELSWGTGTLILEKTSTPNTVNQPLISTASLLSRSLETNPSNSIAIPAPLLPQNQYSVKSYDKNGVFRAASDSTWTTLSFENYKNKWTVSSKKIKSGYSRYLIQAFTNENQYFLKIVDDTSLSEKAINSLGEITLYDTFISTLILMDLAEPGKKETILSEKELSEVFSPAFFAVLDYKKPTNKATRFDSKKPTFIFDRNQEQELLKIYRQIKSDKKSAIVYLKALKSDTIPKDALNLLLKNLKEN